MNKLHRQLVVLCVQHEQEWKKAYKTGKLVVCVQEVTDEYRVCVSWYDDDFKRQQIIVDKYDDEGKAIQVMKRVRQFVYNKLGE